MHIKTHLDNTLYLCGQIWAVLQSLSSQELQLVLLYNHAQTEKKEQGRVQTAEWYLYIWYLVRLAEEERYKLFYLTFTIYIVMILWNLYIIFDGNFVFPLILHSQNTDVNARATCRWEHQPGCPLITLIVHWSSEVPIILYFWSIATSCSYLFSGKLQFSFLSIGHYNSSTDITDLIQLAFSIFIICITNNIISDAEFSIQWYEKHSKDIQRQIMKKQW